ncbi:hypothetical protein ABFX02_03G095500 [Erythranthe guttata]
MGSCISKCSKPNKKALKEDCIHIHEKLVISQDPISSIPSNITKIPSQKPLISQTPSFSSFSCSTDGKCTTASSSSSSSTSSSCESSTSSSLTTVKDRSFSNEFLYSCVKENPHVIGLVNNNSNKVIKEKSTASSPKKQVLILMSGGGGNKIHPHQNLDAKKTKRSSPKKRARTNSPTLVVRQKSFRKENINNNSFSSSSSSQGMMMRSPSPGRRFSTNGNNSVNYGVNRESFRASKASPNRDMTISSRNFSVKKNDTVTRNNFGAKIDRELTDDIIMEDINNPLIALDCFIFL